MRNNVFLENAFTKEEMKLVWETKKILDPNIEVQATCVRVPVINGHSEAIFFRTKKAANKDDIFDLLSKSPGIKLIDNHDCLTKVKQQHNCTNAFGTATPTAATRMENSMFTSAELANSKSICEFSAEEKNDGCIFLLNPSQLFIMHLACMSIERKGWYFFANDIFFTF